MNILSLFSHAGHSHSGYDSAHNYASGSSVSGETYAMSPEFMLFALIIVAACYVICSFLLSRVFKKAGVSTWKAWVPIYNSWILLELGDQKGYWSVLTVVPFVNIVSAVFMYIAMHRIGLKLGKSGAFVILAIFVPLVWMAWVGFDDSKWHGKAPKTS